MSEAILFFLHLLGLLGRGIGHLLTQITKKEKKIMGTQIHVPNIIRTHDSSVRAVGGTTRHRTATTRVDDIYINVYSINIITIKKGAALQEAVLNKRHNKQTNNQYI
jgi:hypothetical protein